MVVPALGFLVGPCCGDDENDRPRGRVSKEEQRNGCTEKHEPGQQIHGSPVSDS